MNRHVAEALAVIAILAASSCIGDSGHHAGSEAIPSASPLTKADARDCPITQPHPVSPRHHWRKGLFGWGSAYGNGGLWVGGLGQNGVITWRASPDGSISYKLGWWRPAGAPLRITGRRLDAPAPPLRSDVPAGYSGNFQASGVTFSTEGCWRVSAQANGTSLTFVTAVVDADTNTNE